MARTLNVPHVLAVAAFETVVYVSRMVIQIWKTDLALNVDSEMDEKLENFSILSKWAKY